MTDFLVRLIPLPLPRPVMEEVVTGGTLQKLEIPVPEMAEVDLSFPLVGSNYWLSLQASVLHQWTGLKDMFKLEGYEGRHGWFEIQVGPVLEYGLVLGALIAVGLFAAGLENLIRKLWK